MDSHSNVNRWQVLSYEKGTLRNMEERFYSTLAEARKQQTFWLAVKPDTYLVTINELL